MYIHTYIHTYIHDIHIHQQLKGDALTLKVDSWAYGTILWELAAEKLPWSHVQGDWTQIKERVCTRGEGLPLLAPSSIPDEPAGIREVYQTIIYHAFSKKADGRPSFVGILNAFQALDVNVLFEAGAKGAERDRKVAEQKHAPAVVINEIGKDGRL
jgi:hypothetical protein